MKKRKKLSRWDVMSRDGTMWESMRNCKEFHDELSEIIHATGTRMCHTGMTGDKRSWS